GALYSQAQYRRAAAQLIMQRDRQVASLAAVRLRDELLKLAAELAPQARSPSLYLGLTDKQRLYLRGQGQRLSVFDGGVVLMDSTGRVRATVPERWDIMSMDWSNQEFFKAMLINPPPGQYFSSILNVGPDNSPVVVVSVPVLGQNGEMVGVLAGLFRLGESRVSAFYASIVRLRLPGTGNTYIADKAGHIVYDSSYQRTGQTLDLAALRATGNAENPAGQPGTVGDRSEFNAALLGAQPAPSLDAEGNEVITSLAPIPDTDWTLVTETDWTQAMAPVQRLATGIIVLLALGMVVPTVGVALLARGQRSAMGEADQAAYEARIGKAMRGQLLPRYTPLLGGWEVAVHHQAGATAAGATARDLYDFMLLPDGRLMIVLATFATRGLSSGGKPPPPLPGGTLPDVHLMTTARAAFRTAACQAPSASRALSLCNNLLCPDVGPNAAIAALYALLDPASGRLQIANAGFSPPLWWSTQPGVPEHDLTEGRENGDFLGQTLDAEFENDDILLEAGDTVIFYSPGALGVRPETGDPFGPERVRRVLNASSTLAGEAEGPQPAGTLPVGAAAVVDALRMDLSEFANADSLRRLDVTFLALSRSPASPTPEKPKRGARSLRNELAALGETDTDL
ncbi:MAG: SpoIIE family protein phosphatase, partial [Nitrososphaerales archaeon]